MSNKVNEMDTKDADVVIIAKKLNDKEMQMYCKIEATPDFVVTVLSEVANKLKNVMLDSVIGDDINPTDVN